MDNYYNKYFKYKRKYIHLKNKYIGGMSPEEPEETFPPDKLEEIIQIVQENETEKKKIIGLLKEGWEKSGWTLQIADKDAKIIPIN